MRKILSFAVLFIFVAQLASAQKVSSSESLLKALQPFKELRPLVKRALSDSRLSERFKRNLLFAFGEDVTLVNFTFSMKNKFGFRSELVAFSTPKDLGFDILSTKNTNDGLDIIVDKMKVETDFFQKDYAVFVSDNNIFEGPNPLLKLIHELAHVRFNRIMRSSVSKLVGKFPEDLLFIGTNGRIQMRSNLFSYLSERYAWEAEFLAFKELTSIKISEQTELYYNFFRADEWGGWLAKPVDKDSLEELARRVRRDYDLEDIHPRDHRIDRLQKMDKIRLHTLLTEGLPKELW